MSRQMVIFDSQCGKYDGELTVKPLVIDSFFEYYSVAWVVFDDGHISDEQIRQMTSFVNAMTLAGKKAIAIIGDTVGSETHDDVLRTSFVERYYSSEMTKLKEWYKPKTDMMTAEMVDKYLGMRYRKA